MALTSTRRLRCPCWLWARLGLHHGCHSNLKSCSVTNLWHIVHAGRVDLHSTVAWISSKIRFFECPKGQAIQNPLSFSDLRLTWSVPFAYWDPRASVGREGRLAQEDWAQRPLVAASQRSLRSMRLAEPWESARSAGKSLSLLRPARSSLQSNKPGNVLGENEIIDDAGMTAENELDSNPSAQALGEKIAAATEKLNWSVGQGPEIACGVASCTPGLRRTLSYS